MKSRLLQLFGVAGTAGAVAFAAFSGGRNNEPPPAHPDEALYANNTALAEQRKILKCDAVIKKGDAVGTDLEKVPGKYQLQRRVSFSFDYNGTKPLSGSTYVRKSVADFAGMKDIGYRFIGCASPSRNRENSAYNKELSQKRIDGFSGSAKEMGVHPDRICEVPMGEFCPNPAAEVHVETFKIELAR